MSPGCLSSQAPQSRDCKTFPHHACFLFFLSFSWVLGLDLRSSCFQGRLSFYHWTLSRPIGDIIYKSHALPLKKAKAHRKSTVAGLCFQLPLRHPVLGHLSLSQNPGNKSVSCSMCTRPAVPASLPHRAQMIGPRRGGL